MRTINLIRRLWLFLLLAMSAATPMTAQAQHSSESAVIVGVLEEGPGDYYGAANTRTVRAVFKKSGNDWRPYPSDCKDQDCLKKISAAYPNEVHWTIAFDGRNLGQVTGRTPPDFRMYWRVGQQEIVSGPAPIVGKRSKDFGGFLDATVYRPLIAVSEPNVKDPEFWKPVVLNNPAAIAGLFRQFRQTFPKLCRIPKSESDALVPFDYRDADIKVVKSYGSKRGWAVAELQIEAMLCDDTEAGAGLYNPWFSVDPAGAAHYFGSGMFLVDAGDYDADGKSELVFSVNSDNRGGYRIFYDDFKKSAVFEYSYH